MALGSGTGAMRTEMPPWLSPKWSSNQSTRNVVALASVKVNGAGASAKAASAVDW